MLDVLARNWWAFAIRGIAALIFGIFALLDPGIALFALIVVFGAYAFVDGIFAIVASVRAAASHERWAALLITGIFGVAIGVITWFHPGLTLAALLLVIAAWAVVTGIFEIVAAFELRRHLAGEWWWLLAGLVSVAFGLFLFWRPAAGALTVVWILAVYALVFGVFLIGLSIRLRGHLNREAKTAPAA